MRRLTVLVATVLAAAALFALAMPAIAGAAYATNAECLACHDQATGTGAITRVDFNVGTDTSVDYTKCKACHWISRDQYIKSRFGHGHTEGTVNRLGNRTGGTDCATCHTDYYTPGTGDLSRLMTVSTPDGWFATSTSSRDTTPGKMHAIHVNGSWPKDARFFQLPCASCHQAAACDACHVSPPASHGDHTWSEVTGVYANPPVTYPVGGGTPVGDTPTVNTVSLDTVTCANPACHPQSEAGTAGFTPFCGSCHPSNLGAHGYESVDHTATAVAEPGSGGIKCDACHAMDLMTEHEKTGGTCVTCHSDSADPGPRDAFGAWDKGCEQCHGVDTTPAKHVGMADKHAAAVTADCVSCHGGTLAEVHTTATTTVDAGVTTVSSCLVCHNATSAPTIPGKTCVSCHFTFAQHYDLTTHNAKSDASVSACASCHDADPDTAGMDLASIHTIGNGCDVCHKNPDPNRIGDLTTKTPECASCHSAQGSDFHVGYVEKHAPTASSGCAGGYGCHDVSDAIALHSSCNMCHVAGAAAPTSIECASCHKVEGTDFHRDVDGAHTGFASGSTTCVGAGCHISRLMPDVHQPFVGSGKKYATTCDLCHRNENPDRIDWATATSQCASCHGMDNGQYHDFNHTATASASAECLPCHGGSNRVESMHGAFTDLTKCATCHNKPNGVGDITYKYATSDCDNCHAKKDIHLGAAGKHASTNTACSGAGCHDVSDASLLHDGPKGCGACHAPGTTLSTDCATCHSGVGASHHALHDASQVLDPGCKGCHSTDLDTEHAALGLTCATCHDSTDPLVVAAIDGKKRSCVACHTAAHVSQNTIEFATGNQSGHRVYENLAGPRTSFYINGAVRTWPLPTDANYLKAGWSSASIVTCDKCHSFASPVVGPQGAAVQVKMDPSYPTDWKTVYLNSGRTSSTTFICAKCHTNFGSMNAVHSDDNHSGRTDGRCIGCHTKVPHGWRLPRLLAYTNDLAPYASLNLTGISVKNRGPNSGWGESDCTQTGCEEHGSSMSNRWPSTTLAFGTISGFVKDAGGAGVDAATVTTDRGQSTTTDASGAYSFASVPAGTVNVTASKVGLITQSKPVTFTDGQAVTLDITLPKLGSIAGVVTDSVSSARLAGVTVSITGGSVVTGADGAFSFTGKTAGTYSVTFSKAGYTTQTKSVVVANDTIADASVVLAPLPNLALLKTFVASRYQGSPAVAYAPGNAGDANLATYWWSNSAGTATTVDWLTVDLGSSQSISKVEVAWAGAYYAKSFRILTSTSSTMPSVGSNSWSSVYSTTSAGTAGTSTITFNSRNARWVRVECRTTSGAATGYGVAEMRVFQ
jgi:hypothetical protein